MEANINKVIIVNHYAKLLASSITIGLITSFAGCSKHEEIKGTGNSHQETREVSKFSGIKVAGDYSVIGKIGSPQEFTMASNKNVLPYITTEVDDGVLVIAYDENVDVFPSVPQSIWFTGEEIKSIALDGTTNFQLTGINTDELTIALAGSHTVYLDGKAANLHLKVSGSSNFNAKNLDVSNADIEINGSGVAGVTVKDNLKVTIKGDGQVMYYNYQPKVEESIKGSGRVINNSVPQGQQGIKLDN